MTFEKIHFPKLNNLFSKPIQKINCIEKTELLLLSAIVIGFLIFFAFTNFLNGDEREHVSAAFFIYNGKVPYRDFFEHHHPLLWYTFLPFIHIFNNSADIWYAARIYSLLLYIINSYFIIKICRLIINNTLFAWLAVLFSLSPHCVFLSQSEFRPDSLMMTFFLGGLYFLFSYIKEPKNQLKISFLLLFFSIMTLQKACFQLIPLFFFILYLLYKQTISIKAFAKALLLPLMIAFLYILYLWQTGSLKDYFELNWLLNLKIHTHIQYPVHQTPYYHIANILALLTLFIKAPKFLKVIAILCLSSSAILQFIFIGAFRHYWLPLYPYFAIISAYYITALHQKIRPTVIALVTVALITNYTIHYKQNKYFPSLQTFVYLSEQILKLSNKDDLILNSSTIGGLRNSAAGYYWIGMDHVALLDNHYFNRHELPDFYTLIRTRKPKLFSTDYPRVCIDEKYHFTLDCKYFPPSAEDKEFLEQNYNNQGFLYVRKK